MEMRWCIRFGILFFGADFAFLECVCGISATGGELPRSKNNEENIFAFIYAYSDTLISINYYCMQLDKYAILMAYKIRLLCF